MKKTAGWKVVKTEQGVFGFYYPGTEQRVRVILKLIVFKADEYAGLQLGFRSTIKMYRSSLRINHIVHWVDWATSIL